MFWAALAAKDKKEFIFSPLIDFRMDKARAAGPVLGSSGRSANKRAEEANKRVQSFEKIIFFRMIN